MRAILRLQPGMMHSPLSFGQGILGRAIPLHGEGISATAMGFPVAARGQNEVKGPVARQIEVSAAVSWIVS